MSSKLRTKIALEQQGGTWQAKTMPSPFCSTNAIAPFPALAFGCLSGSQGIPMFPMKPHAIILPVPVVLESLVLCADDDAGCFGNTRCARSPHCATSSPSRGDQLMEGDKPFRFISFQPPQPSNDRRQHAFHGDQSLALPDEFEIRDGLMTVRQMGGTVVRTYRSPSCAPTTPWTPRHVLGPGSLTKRLSANSISCSRSPTKGVRLIIPLVNNWKWQGGRAESEWIM